ncbi:50S ribosomal protein L30 [Egibacter rhizosphaerae]|uniref:50S ribosomal protein L30 n=1 Tax=Egibacter rhizosphaerae TaxID=1670831 RepID=UPI00197AA37F|nr:50S ribosomal protein L30 [Egibacter rhizosphaerae]
MRELEVTQVRSTSGQQEGQRRTLRALGLRRRHQTVTRPDRPEVRGMLAKVAHLVEVRYPGEGEVLDLEPGQEPKGVGNPPAGQSVADDEAAEIAAAEEAALTETESEGDVDPVPEQLEEADLDEPADDENAEADDTADTTEDAEEADR